MQWTSNIYMSKMQRCNIGLAAQPSYCITTECRAVSFPIPKAPPPLLKKKPRFNPLAND